MWTIIVNGKPAATCWGTFENVADDAVRSYPNAHIVLVEKKTGKCYAVQSHGAPAHSS